MAKGNKQRFRQRAAILLSIILVTGFGAAICRLGYLSLAQGSVLSEKAVEQQLKDTTISACRGTIYDTNGKVLAQSATVWQVVFAPAYFKNDTQRQIVADGLAPILGMSVADVLAHAKKNNYFEIVKRRIESDARDKILKFIDKIEKEDGISNVIELIQDYKRYYPYGNFASAVLGFTGSDDQGLAGVEYQYNDYLTGKSGRIITAKNANGMDMPYNYEQLVPAQQGDSVVLTIDETIQHILEKYVQQEIVKDKVINRAVAIMMNVNTGAILGMAVEGGFDPNHPFDIADSATASAIKKLPVAQQSNAIAAAQLKQWRNKAISDTYYPGSVFKIITSSMALQEKVVDDKWHYTCTGSLSPAPGVVIHCSNTSGHGTQNFLKALCNSCNPAFMTIGKSIGAARFYKYFQAFGFTQKTGIDLPGESEDIFFKHDNEPEGYMDAVDLACASFGQNFSITPIQLITAISSVANGGNLVQPYVVSKVLDSNGNVVKATEPKVKRQVISSDVAAQLRSMLQTNATTGGARNGYVAGYHVAGKTGTTEKKDHLQGPDIEDYISSFCGFCPAEKPQVALLVYFDTPTSGAYYGSMVAAPVFGQCMKEILPYLHIEPQYTAEELSNLDIKADSYVGDSVAKAKNSIQNSGLTSIVKGSGDKVVRQIPESGASVPKNGTVVLFTDSKSAGEQVSVPKLTGLSMTEVNRIASMYDLNVCISGASSSGGNTSVTQDIEQGTLVSPGTVISISFANSSSDDSEDIVR